MATSCVAAASATLPFCPSFSKAPASASLRSAFLPRRALFPQRASPPLPRGAHGAQHGGARVGSVGGRAKGVRAEAQPEKTEGKVPFGYSRKDVILIGVGITAGGFGLKYGLELLGFDSFQSGAVVQLGVVLGLCLLWAASYVWRVGNKEMTYVKQLKDYEDAVMKKRLEAMPETELEAMLAQVEEEKERLREKREGKKQ